MRTLPMLLLSAVLVAGCNDNTTTTPDKPSSETVTESRSVTRSDNMNGPTTTQPNNTEKNKRDRSGDTKTPFDQSNDSADIKITADLRQAIVNDKNLSFSAQNIKIITANGVVTLRGPVASTEERDSIVAKATQLAGVSRVDNQLEVTPLKP